MSTAHAPTLTRPRPNGMPEVLVDREPGTADYESARTFLGEHFPHGHTASTLLSQYREGLIDLTVIEVDLGDPSGVVPRLIITTCPRKRRS